MKRLLKSWVFWVFILVPTAWAVVRFTYRHARVQVCSACMSERVETQWRFGVQNAWDVALGPLNVGVFETRVHGDGWAGAHKHEMGITVTGCYPKRMFEVMDGLLAAYEMDPAFRAYMLAKRERGEVSREAFLAALNPFEPDDSAPDWVGEFQQRESGP